MMKVAIIDDEEDARFMLRNILEKHFSTDIKIIAEADGVESGLEILEAYDIDILFLDIQMQTGTGFDLLNKIDKKDFEVVFITAFDQYAVKAFKFSALGYLMKPIKVKEIKALIENLKIHFENHGKQSDKRLKVLVENYGDDKTIKKLVISNIDGFKVIDLENIISLQGDRNYTNFVTCQDKRYTSAKTLGEYEALLSEFGFFRIHQSTIVNLRHVKAYYKGDGGMVEMINDEKLQVSRNRRGGFVKRFV
ncbi:MAG: LytTR family DNA-binding domain-containing protein [Brumimicrobium sp.]